MPTDETTLDREALERLVRAFSDSTRHEHGLTPMMVFSAAEARLIADALRFKLASLTAPAAHDPTGGRDAE